MKTKGGMRTILWLSFAGFSSSIYSGFMTSAILFIFDCARNSKTEVIEKTQIEGIMDMKNVEMQTGTYRSKLYQ